MEEFSTEASLRSANGRRQKIRVTNSGRSAKSHELFVVEENDFIHRQKGWLKTHLASRRNVFSCASMARLAASAIRRLRGGRTGSMMSRLPSVVTSSSISWLM